MAERANLYDNIIDPVTGYTYPVKSKKGARIVKNYMSIYKYADNPNDSEKLLISSPYYNNLLIMDRNRTHRYKTFKNVTNDTGEEFNEAYPHVLNYYNNLGEFLVSEETVLKILILCANKKSFDKKIAFNWLIHLHPIMMAEIVSANLPLEITYLSAPGQKLDEGIIFEKESGIDDIPCDMHMIQSNCIRHNIVVGLVPDVYSNRKLREAGNPENLKIDVLGNNKYDIIIDENCPKFGNISIDYRALFHHMTYNTWLVFRDHTNRMREFTLIDDELVEDIKELKRLNISEDFNIIQRDISKLEKELKRLGIYNYVKQKYLIASKMGNHMELIADNLKDLNRGFEFPLEDKALYYSGELLKYRNNQHPYNYGQSSIFTVNVIKLKRSVFS